MTNKDKYISIQELADLKGVSTRAIRMSRDKYVTREIIVRGGKVLKSYYQVLSWIYRTNILSKRHK